MASSGLLGNPIRETNPSLPARRAESGTYHSGSNRSRIERKDQGKDLCQEVSSELGVHGLGNSQNEQELMGLSMGRSGEVPPGLHGHVEIEQNLAGQAAACQTMNMEIILPAAAEASPGDRRAGHTTPTLNTKKWKRGARQVNQLSVLSQASRNAKRGRVETDANQLIGGIGSEK
jgi:hypothetical protein